MAHHARRLAGRCSNGSERDSGSVFHAVVDDGYPCREPALCGAKPGRLSAGWDTPRSGQVVTCSRCAARLRRSNEAGRGSQEKTPARLQISNEVLAALAAPGDGTTGIQWAWYEDSSQVWTASCADFYLEVDGSTGHCEIAEWDPDSADIGETLWEARCPGESVQKLQRAVERALPSVAHAAGGGSLPLIVAVLLGTLRSEARATMADAYRVSREAGFAAPVAESVALVALDRIARKSECGVRRYYVDRATSPAQLRESSELRDALTQYFAGDRTFVRDVEVVWATSPAAALRALQDQAVGHV